MSDTESQRNPVERLAEEFLERFRRGERPSIAEYVAQYPNLAQEIEELFPLLADVEGALSETGQASPGAAVVADTDFHNWIDDYQIVREIGRGGMGVVYEAVQQSLSRRVALKVLPGLKPEQDEVALKRFQREARAAARLHHTNIVPVFDVGQAGPISYYAMQYIDGRSLDGVVFDLRRRLAVGKSNPSDSQALRDITVAVTEPHLESGASTDPVTPGPTATTVATRAGSDELPGRKWIESISDGDALSRPTEAYYRSVAQVGTQITQALAYAHARGVVHRDIKPSNLLLDTNGVVWITDFGMAKVDAEPLTRTGDILGTLHYMAPERFKGDCDARADIYAAGLTIYELLTLKPAFESSDRLRLVELISKQAPTRPRVVDERIPRDLETIVLKSIEKDPDQRYQTADAFADDFQRFLEDRPIHARQVGLPERFVRWTRRNPVLSGMSVAIVLLLGIAAAVATTAAFFLEKSRNRAVSAERQASARAQQVEHQSDELRQQDYVSRVNLAYLEIRNDNVARAIELLDGCPPTMRGWEWDFVNGQCRVAVSQTKERLPSINCLAFSPDGGLIAIGSGNFLGRRGTPGDLVVREVDSGRVVFEKRGLSDGLSAVAFSHDGQRVAVARGRTLTVWNLETGQTVFSVPDGPLDLLALEYSPDGRFLAGGYGRFNGSTVGRVHIWDADSGDLVGQPIRGRAGGGWSLSFDPSGRRIALTGTDGVDVWDVESRIPLRRLHGHDGFVYCVDFHPNGELIATGGLDRAIRLWNVKTGELVRVYTGHAGFVRGVAFSDDGRRLVSASEDKSVKLWDVGREREIATFRGHIQFVNCVAFGKGGNMIASGGLDQTLRIWFAATDQQLKYEGHLKQGHARALAFSPDGKAIATGSFRFSGPTDRLHLWDPETGRQTVRFPQNVGEVAAIAYHPNGRLLAAGHPNGFVTLWDTASGTLVERLEAHVGEVFDVEFSPDGATLVSVGQDTGVNFWDADTGALKHTATGHRKFVTAVDYSPDGRLLATSSQDGTIKVWDASSARELQTFSHGEGEVRSVAFSPDGQSIASTGGIHHRAGYVKLWHLEDQSSRDLKGHTDIVYDVDFSPDGKRVATASDDRTVRLWDTASGEEAFAIRGHTGGVVSVAFSPDGKQIASGSVDRTVRVWSLRSLGADVYYRREAVAKAFRGREALKDERWHDAINAFGRAIDLGIDDVSVHIDRFVALSHLGERTEAEQAIPGIIEKLSQNSHDLVDFATVLASWGYYDGAREGVTRAVQQQPNDPAVWQAVATIRAADVASANAAEAFQRLVATGDQRSGATVATGWWAAGPFAKGDDAVKDALSPFERSRDGVSEDENVVDWIVAPTDGDGYLDLDRWLGADEQRTTYAVKHIHSPKDQDVAFLLGRDDELRLWLNGRVVFERTRATRASIGQHVTVLPLKAGWNRVVARVTDRSGPHGMYLRISQEPRDLARGFFQLKQLDRVVDVWNSASPEQRGDSQLLLPVGNALARRGRWHDAVAIFGQLIQRQPARNRNWVTLAPLLVHCGDVDGYRQYCADLLAHFGDSEEAVMAERTAKATLLMPLDVARQPLPCELARRAVEKGRNHSFLPYFLLAQGLSEYRSEDYRQAVLTLTEALERNRSREPYLDTTLRYLLAMSHHRLDALTEATDHLHAANKIMADRLPNSDAADLGIAWSDWLICGIFRHEAEVLLGGRLPEIQRD